MECATLLLSIQACGLIIHRDVINHFITSQCFNRSKPTIVRRQWHCFEILLLNSRFPARARHSGIAWTEKWCCWLANRRLLHIFIVKTLTVKTKINSLLATLTRPRGSNTKHTDPDSRSWALYEAIFSVKNATTLTCLHGTPGKVSQRAVRDNHWSRSKFTYIACQVAIAVSTLVTTSTTDWNLRFADQLDYKKQKSAVGNYAHHCNEKQCRPRKFVGMIFVIGPTRNFLTQFLILC